jgi:hypothetical protein
VRLLRMFGLAALAAVAAMALAGVGTAAAETTVMCRVEATPCPVESIFTQGTHGTETGTKIEAEAKTPRLKIYKNAGQTEIENEIECERSTVVGRYQEKGTQEEPQHKGEIKSGNVTECFVKAAGKAFRSVIVLGNHQDESQVSNSPTKRCSHGRQAKAGR